MPTPTPTAAPELAEGPTDEEILAAYQMAEEAYGWFVLAPPELDRTEQRTVGSSPTAGWTTRASPTWRSCGAT